MKLTLRLKKSVENYKNNVILVEGKKDVQALNSSGFNKVFQIHKNSKSIRESLEDIFKFINKDDKVSILTDLDKKGNEFNNQIISILQELGFQIDLSFRKLLIKANISHIEGIYNFLNKVEGL